MRSESWPSIPEELAPSLSISVVASRSVCVVSVSGELDAHTAPGLDEHLRLLSATEPPRIDLDLADVPFIDSAGLRTLLLSAGRLREQGSILVVTRVSPAARRLLEITGLVEVLMSAGDA